MIEDEITHKSTLKCVRNLNIDISEMKDMNELREFIKKNRKRIYQKLKLADYMRDYMRNRYRLKRDLKEKKI